MISISSSTSVSRSQSAAFALISNWLVLVAPDITELTLLLLNNQEIANSVTVWFASLASCSSFSIISKFLEVK